MKIFTFLIRQILTYSLILTGFSLVAKDGQMEIPEHHFLRVALLFDDGPTPELNSDYLDLFAKEGIAVTFAQVAQNAAAHPEISQRVQKTGHEILNHSNRHQHPFDLSDEELSQEIRGAQSIFSELLDHPPVWYWPPFIEKDDRVIAEAKAAGMKVLTPPHLVISQDWDRNVDAKTIYRLSTTGVQDGSIILFHEWREETLEQLPAIIDNLRQQGCRFLTVSELMASTVH